MEARDDTYHLVQYRALALRALRQVAFILFHASLSNTERPMCL